MIEQKTGNTGNGMGLVTDKAAFEILKQRAKLLARVDTPSMGNGEIIWFTEFTLSGEHYGIENKYICEIRPLKVYTPLPGAPSHILGIINSKGKIIAVVDLKKYFDLPNKGISEMTKVIMIKQDSMEFGLLVDTVIGVESCSEGELLDSLPIIKGIKEAFIKGMTSNRIALLDGTCLLNDKKIIVNDRI